MLQLVGLERDRRVAPCDEFAKRDARFAHLREREGVSTCGGWLLVFTGGRSAVAPLTGYRTVSRMQYTQTTTCVASARVCVRACV